MNGGWPLVRVEMRIKILIDLIYAERESRQPSGQTFPLDDRPREPGKHHLYELPEAQFVQPQMISHPAERDDTVFAAVAGRRNEVTDAIEKVGECFPAEFRFVASINLRAAVRRQ